MRAFSIAATVLTIAGVGALSPLAGAQGNTGEQLYRQRCQSCHSLAANGPETLGPNLHNVAGRKAGATSFRYSPAMKSAKITWTRENLEKYLTGPSRLVPGTRMAISVANPEQRALLIEYLSTMR